MSRSDVREFCKDAKNKTEACFIVIMAWGGMRHDHGRKAWSARDDWIQTLNEVRFGNLSRIESFAILNDCRDKNHLPCIGPAYFTKLIYFLRPEQDGYIMDQWTARSINLIYGDAVVPLVRSKTKKAHSFTVSCSRTTPQNYSNFCELVDKVGEFLGVSGGQTEEFLFSWGGRQPGKWRQYVKENHTG